MHIKVFALSEFSNLRLSYFIQVRTFSDVKLGTWVCAYLIRYQSAARVRAGDSEACWCQVVVMIQLQPVIDRIKVLLADDTEQSVTYAALEARLALEKVCYDRLRQRHDYISHDQLRRWQPGAIINTLMKEVDEHVGQTLTISIGKSPAEAGVKPEDDEYVPIGTEVGFDAKRIAKMWNALAKLALHVRLPEHKDDHIADYGDKARTRAKVEEVLSELERLAKGTMTFSGMGDHGHSSARVARRTNAAQASCVTDSTFTASTRSARSLGRRPGTRTASRSRR